MVGAIPPAPRYEHVHIQQMPQRLLPDLREVCEPFPGGFHREPRQVASPFEDSSASHRTPCATHGFLWRERGFSLAPQKLRAGQSFPPCAFADQPGPVIADFQGERGHGITVRQNSASGKPGFPVYCTGYCFLRDKERVPTGSKNACGHFPPQRPETAGDAGGIPRM